MTKRLSDNLTSAYFEAANRMKPRKARKRIVAYVESYDDVFFWRTVLSRYEDETRYFEVMLPSHTTLERGKKAVLMNLFADKVGESMIACVDADYDYLLQQTTATSRLVNTNPYVLHTYAYAIENLQCYAPSLHNVCVMVTLNDHMIFDFDDFFKRISEAVFPLFVWSIWHYRKGIYGEFTITDFNRVVELGGFSVTNPQFAIEGMRRKVRNKVNSLQHHHPEAKAEYKALEQELVALGVTPQTTYLYIQGHHLFNKVVIPIMNRVCSILVQERENEIRCQAMHDTQCRNELSCYSNSIQDIAQMMKKSTGYIDSPPFQRIRRDVERMLGTGVLKSAEKGTETSANEEQGNVI